jgi:hypothetical protein
MIPTRRSSITRSPRARVFLRRIEDLLNIAKMEDGQFGYKFEDADISDFISKVFEDVLPAAQKAGSKFISIVPGIPAARHDRSAPASLALTNLLENAIRYNVENGEVTVKVDKMQDKPFVVVSVKDTGIGIPPEAMEKLFNKFYRADNAHEAPDRRLRPWTLYRKRHRERPRRPDLGRIRAQSRHHDLICRCPTDPNAWCQRPRSERRICSKGQVFCLPLISKVSHILICEMAPSNPRSHHKYIFIVGGVMSGCRQRRRIVIDRKNFAVARIGGHVDQDRSVCERRRGNHEPHRTR